MKFCYADESLDDRGENVQVMVGIVADAQRLNRSRLEFSEIFKLVEDVFPEALKELKGSRIFYGRGGWRDVPPEIGSVGASDAGSPVSNRHLLIYPPAPMRAVLSENHIRTYWWCSPARI